MTQAAILAASGSPGTTTGFKNKVINGNMVIDQRNAGASITPTDGQFSVDRFGCRLSQASKYSAQQNAGSVTPPVGFTNYLGITSLSAYTVGSGDNFNIQHRIEGYNFADLGWGTANAKTVTISFWVYSSLTGSFGAAFNNASGNRTYPFSYTISSANTWTQVSVTVAGDTSGTWNTTNGRGLEIDFSLGAGSSYTGTAGSWSANFYLAPTGSVNVVSTNGATWYITGVQLEVGTTATNFDFRSYGTEFALCQRYYYRLNGNQTYSLNGNDGGLWLVTAYNSTSYYGGFVYPVIPRTGPTWSYSNLSNMVLVGAGSSAVPSNFQIQTGINRVEYQFSTASGWLSPGQSGWLRMNQNDWLAYNAEL